MSRVTVEIDVYAAEQGGLSVGVRNDDVGPHIVLFIGDAAVAFMVEERARELADALIREAERLDPSSPGRDG